MALLDQKILAVFREVFDNDAMEITDQVSAKDVPEWDSLAQVRLILALEEEFGVEFSAEETGEMTCVGDLKKVLIAKGIAV